MVFQVLEPKAVEIRLWRGSKNTKKSSKKRVAETQKQRKNGGVLTRWELLVLTLVSDENESVFIIGSKLYHVFCDDKKVQMGRSRSDAQLKMSTVSAQVPVILLFLT